MRALSTRSLSRLAASMAVCLAGACEIDSDDDDDTDDEGVVDGGGLPGDGDGDDGDGDGGADGSDGDGGTGPAACDPQSDDLTLPDGFCAQVFADQLGLARHISVTPSGDVFVALGNAPDGSVKGQVVALRDSDGDGQADMEKRFADDGGNGIAWHQGRLYFAQTARILRYDMPDGQLEPSGDPVTVVSGLPDDGDHTAKTVVVRDDTLLVNIGSASNSCQEENRKLESPGVNPCPELEVRAGIWQFSASEADQTLEDGARYAKGGRNLNALALEPETGTLFAVQNGRDQLWENWPELYTAEDDARLPAEVLLEVDEGDDFGWPYCYYDALMQANVLAPEYGGDGSMVGRCAAVELPVAAYGAHWAPLGAVFYEGELFPAHYRHGLFIANHGSRFAPDATGDLPGYDVIFQPFVNHEARGPHSEFATGFAGAERPLPDEAVHRPVGLAVGPDGALYVSDDKGGRLWRVIYQGPGDTPGHDGGVPDGGVQDGGPDDAGAAAEDASADAATPPDGG